MNNELRIFENEEFGEIRTTVIDNAIYFCANDVAKALGYARPNNAIQQHCRATLKQGTLIRGKIQEINFIGEGDLYRLVMKSKLPSAQRFESWVCDEVLPDIRKHGMYATTDTVNMMLNNPDLTIKLLEEYKKEKEEKDRLLKEREESLPKVMAYDDFISQDGTYSIATTAKILNIPRSAGSDKVIGRNTLLSYLRRDGILIKDGAEKNTPYQKYVGLGLFKLKASDGEQRKPSAKISTRVTAKGIDYLYKKYRYDNMPKEVAPYDEEEYTDTAL